MFEARLEQGNLLKKIIEAIRELVTDCNWDCNDDDVSLQAMDNSHVALVAMKLTKEGFSPYRCDRNMSLGINVATLSKVLKTAGDNDHITLKAQEEGDTLALLFENPSSDRTAEYELKLMDIDSEHLGIPTTPYNANITMPSGEFARICRDLNVLNESVLIDVTKESIRFSASGDVGRGAINLKPTSSVDKEEENISIQLESNVSLHFSLKYLLHFSKATPLSKTVKLSMSHETPLLVEYQIEDFGYLQFYLAPKLGED